MGERTSYPAGTFSWTDLAASDADAAKAFYGAVLGWEFEDMPVPDSPPYSMAKVGGRTVAAVYQAQQGPPAWLSYVTVLDADAAAARAGELGASVISEPFDVMDAGRMSVLQDPAGAVFAIWQAGRTKGAELVNDPGALTMNQLNTSDPAAAQSFYEGLFGWSFAQVSPDPPFWSIANDGRLNGGMMPAQPGVPSHWLAYFTTADLDAAVGRVGDAGGTVVAGPIAIPAGRFVVASDPQSATFALFEGETDP